MEVKRWCFNTDIRVFGTAMREHSRFSVLLNNSALTVKSAVLALKRPAPLGSTGQNNTDLTPKSFTQRLASRNRSCANCGASALTLSMSHVPISKMTKS